MDSAVQDHLVPAIPQNNDLPIDKFDDFQSFKDHTEKLFIAHKLKQYAWNVAKTAEVIGIQRSHLYNKIDKYQLKREDV
jgi:DNA-binding NtrC family response regulator